MRVKKTNKQNNITTPATIIASQKIITIILIITISTTIITIIIKRRKKRGRGYLQKPHNAREVAVVNNAPIVCALLHTHTCIRWQRKNKQTNKKPNPSEMCGECMIITYRRSYSAN